MKIDMLNPILIGGGQNWPPHVFLRYFFLRLRYIAATFCKLIFQLLTTFAKKKKFTHIFFSDLCARCQKCFFEIVDFQVLLIQNHQITKNGISSSKLLICIWNLVKCKILGGYLMKKNVFWKFPFLTSIRLYANFRNFRTFYRFSTSTELLKYYI